MQGEQGAEGVAVRVLVGGEEEAVALADLIRDLVEIVAQQLSRPSSLVEQTRDAVAAVHALVIVEGQGRRSLESHRAGDLPL